MEAWQNISYTVHTLGQKTPITYSEVKTNSNYPNIVTTNSNYPNIVTTISDNIYNLFMSHHNFTTITFKHLYNALELTIRETNGTYHLTLYRNYTNPVTDKPCSDVLNEAIFITSSKLEEALGFKSTLHSYIEYLCSLSSAIQV